MYVYIAIQGKAMAACLQKNAAIDLDVRLVNIIKEMNERVAAILLDPSKIEPSH